MDDKTYFINEIRLEYGGKFDSLIEIATKASLGIARCKAALYGAPVAWNSDRHTLIGRQHKYCFEFAVEFCKLSRYSRSLGSVKLNDSVFMALKERLFDTADFALYNAVASAAPEAVTNLDEGAVKYDWGKIDMRTLKGIESKLCGNKINAEWAEYQLATILQQPLFLITPHLGVFAVDDFFPKSTHDQLLLTLLKGSDFDPQEFNKHVEPLLHLHQELEKTAEGGRAEYIRKWQRELHTRQESLHGFVEPFVITPAVCWNDFHAVCREHFGDQVPENCSEPANWGEFALNSDYLLAIVDNGVAGQAQLGLTMLFRRVAALTESLRHENGNGPQGDFFGGGFKVEGLAIPFTTERPKDIPQFSDFASESPSRWTFHVAVSPFASAEELNNRDFGRAISMMLEGKLSRNLMLALENFEAATCLGLTGVEISEQVGNRWRIASLWTALEIISNCGKEEKLNDVLEYLRKNFEQGRSSRGQIEQAQSLVRTFYGRRNAVVHADSQNQSNHQASKQSLHRQLVMRFAKRLNLRNWLAKSISNLGRGLPRQIDLRRGEPRPTPAAFIRRVI